MKSTHKTTSIVLALCAGFHDRVCNVLALWLECKRFSLVDDRNRERSHCLFQKWHESPGFQNLGMPSIALQQSISLDRGYFHIKSLSWGRQRKTNRFGSDSSIRSSDKQILIIIIITTILISPSPHPSLSQPCLILISALSSPEGS